jgi:hypothetical protein
MRRSEERKAGENAKGLLGRLRPETARTDRIIFILRYAANLAATTALIRGLESKKALDATTRNRQGRSMRCAACWTGGFSLKTRSTKPSGRLKHG